MQKILIIEDDEKLRNELETFLNKNGFVATSLKKFDNAVEDILNEKADLLLLDINLPYTDGEFICKEIRKISNVPIIMVTSRDSEMDELLSLNYGADQYVTKPYNIQILLAKIVGLLKRNQNAGNNPDKIDCGEFVLNTAGRIIEKEDNKVELTKNEYKILEYLVLHRQKVISRDETMIIPIAQHKEGVLEKANELLEQLKNIGIRVKLDSTDKTPGYKFSEQEMLGIPTRIEIGPKDIEKNQVVVARRDTGEKITISLNEIDKKLPEILEDIQQSMYKKAESFLNSHIKSAITMEEMIEKFNNERCFIKAMWCGSEECEDKIKSETGGAGSRCIPFNEEKLSDKCICCGKEAKHMVIWGKSY